MSFFSNYFKNVKSGFQALREGSVRENRARNNPRDTYADVASGKAFGYASRQAQEDTESSDSFKKSVMSSQHIAAQKKQREAAVLALNKSNRDARNDPSNFSSETFERDGKEVTTTRFNDPKATSVQSRKFQDLYGLTGIGNNQEFEGMTREGAMNAAQNKNEFYRNESNANTSYTFNPETINKTNDLLGETKFKLNETTSDSWNSKQSVENKTKAVIEMAEQNLAKNFETPEDFNQAYNSNAQIRNTVDELAALGLDPMKVASQIAPTPSLSNQFGQANIQDMATFLNVDDATELKAFDSMIPEGELAINQIQEIAEIPQEYLDIYMGTEEQIGILGIKVKEKQQELKILEREASLNEENMEEQANLAKSRYSLKFDIESTQIEENRLVAKNYMAGALAKLGALKTTGAAPQAMATLESKYQMQAKNLSLEYKLNKQAVDLKLDQAMDEISIGLERESLKLQSELTLEKEDIYLEVFKLQKESQEDSFRVMNSFAKSYRSQLEKYKKAARKASEDYIAKATETVSDYDVNGMSEQLGLDSNMTFDEFLQSKADNEGVTLITGHGAGATADLQAGARANIDLEGAKKQFPGAYAKLEEEYKETMGAMGEQENEDKYGSMGAYARDVVDGNANYPTGSSKTHQNARNELRAAGYSKSDFDEDKEEGSSGRDNSAFK